jgi:cephalosporin-C deacetylase
MPLSELLNYRGRNEKPDDFDAYWDEAQREVDALGTAHELEDAAFQVPAVACRHLYFTGTGGARVHALLLYPRSIREAVPAVVMFHGTATARATSAPSSAGSRRGSASRPWIAAGRRNLAGRIRRRRNDDHGHIVRGLSDIDPKSCITEAFSWTRRSWRASYGRCPLWIPTASACAEALRAAA